MIDPSYEVALTMLNLAQTPQDMDRAIDLCARALIREWDIAEAVDALSGGGGVHE